MNLAGRVVVVIALVLALGTTLVAAPTEEAEAADPGWSTVSTPTLGFLAVMPDSSIDAIALASDGTTMYAGLNAGPVLGPLAPAQWMVAKSTDAGLSWTQCSANPGIAGPIVDMAVAPDDANHVVLTDGATVWRTSDGGVTWQVLGTAYTIAFTAAAPVINSVDVGPLMSGTHPIVVGISDGAPNAAPLDANGVYIWGWGSPPNVSWAPQVLAQDVVDVAFSPIYASDFTIVAVGCTAVLAQVHLGNGLVAVAPPGNWDFAGGYAGWPIIVDPMAGVTSADIAFPDNWNGALGGGQIVLVGTAGGAMPDVYFVNNTAATALGSGVTGAYSIDFVGATTGSHALIVGDTAAAAAPYANVRFTNNIASAMAWDSPYKLPTGLTGMALVLFDPDYLTSGIAYCATGGAAGTIDESALSRTTDSCVSWNQVSIINTYMNAGMLDMAPSPDYANDNTLFLVTGSTAAGPGAPFPAGSNYESLWISNDDGVHWERIDLRITANGAAIVRPSPEWATDGTVYWADAMVFFGAAATTIRRSTDGGANFTTKTAFGAIAAIAVENSTTLYVVSGMQVGNSSDGGSSWPVIGNALHYLSTIAREPNTGDLAVVGSGAIYLIQDTSTMATTPVGSISGAGLGSVQFIAFSHDYETTGLIYIADAGAVGGIWKLEVGGDPPQPRRIGITAAALPAAGNAVGVVVSPEGVLYAADAWPPAAGAAVWRSVNPSASEPEFEALTAGLDSLPLAAVIGQLKLASGSSNVLFAIETANDQVNLFGSVLCGDRLMSYTDVPPLPPPPGPPPPLGWWTVGTPTLGFLTIMPDSSKDAIALASDGTTMYVGLDAGPLLGPLGPARWMVARSTDAGLSWAYCSANPGIVGPIVDIAVAPDDANHVVVTDGITLWRTNDGGGTWQALGTAATIAVAAAAPVINSLDVGPLMSGTHPIVVGISDGAPNAAPYDANGVYIWGWGSPPNPSWSPQALGEDVVDAAFSPIYASDFTVVAVGSPVAANTRVHLGSGLNAQAPANLNWDALGAPVLYPGWPIIVDPLPGVTSADIAFPDNWNGALGGRQILLVGTAGGAMPDVYYVNNVGATALGSGVVGANSIDFVGATTGSHALIVGDTAPGAAPYANVRFTNNIASAGAWGSPIKPPTGMNGMALVVLDPDYLTSGTAYCATGGAAGTIDENALSRTTDSCVSWNQVSIINTYMNAGMLDMAPSPDYANDNTLFLVTGCTAAGPGGPFSPGSDYESLWISTNLALGRWERVDLRITANGAAIVRPSPEWATDGTVYWADAMVPFGAAATTIRRSTDGGAYFGTKTAFGPIYDMAVEDSTTLYVVTGMQVGKSSDGGTTWPIIGNALDYLWTIAREPNTGDLAIASSGAIYLIQDTSTMATTPVGSISGAGLGSLQLIAFSYDYETTGLIYIADAGAVGGIWKLEVGGDPPQPSLIWDQPWPGDATGLVMGEDGALYCADAYSGAGVWRSVNPSASEPEFEALTKWLDWLPFAAIIGQLKLASGSSNVLFAIETANDQVALFGAVLCGDRLMTYTEIPPITEVPVEVEDASVTPGGSASVDIWVRNFPEDGFGLGAYDIRIDYDPTMIEVTGVSAGDAPFDAPVYNIEADYVSIAQFIAEMPGPTGDIRIADLEFTCLAEGETTLALTIETLANTNGDEIPATPIDGTITQVSRVAETAIAEDQDGDGVVVIPATILSVKDAVTGEPVFGIAIGAYEARTLYDPAGIEMLTVRPGDPPFDEPVFSINNAGGYTNFSQSGVPGSEPEIMLARLVPRLVGCALNSYELQVTFDLIADTEGGEIREQEPQFLSFQKGDIKGDGVVNIIDAMFGAQYVVGLRPVEEINQLNMASVKHDDGGDIKDIIDCMYIAQYVVGLRNCYFELTPPPLCTYTHPEVGYGYEYPCDWEWWELEEIMIGDTPAPVVIEESEGMIQFVTGFQSPTAEDGYYPNIVTFAYVLPVPFAPRAFYEMSKEPDPVTGESVWEQMYPGFSPVWDEDVTTTYQDRVALLFSATWTSPEHGALQMMGILVSKAGNMYFLTCTTTQDTWGEYEDMFRYIALSITVPDSVPTVQELKFGMGIPLSGALGATIGLPAKFAFELAAEDIGQFTVGGQTYRWNLIFEDNVGSVAGGAASANKFIYEHDVDFMHQMGADPGFCAAEITEVVGMILDIAGASPFDYGPDLPHTFQTAPTWHAGVATFFDWLAKEHPEVKVIAMTFNESSEGMAIFDAVQAACEYYGFELYAVAAPMVTIEWYPVATKIMTYDPDLVIGPIELFEVLWDFGYEGLAGTYYWTEAGPEQVGWDTCQGYLIFMPHPIGGLWPEVDALRAEYEDRYVVEFMPAAFWAANLLYVMTEALMQAGTVGDVDIIIETMETGTFDTLVGPVYYDLEALIGIPHIAVWPSPIYEVVGEREYVVHAVYTPEETEAIANAVYGLPLPTPTPTLTPIPTPTP